MRRLQLAPQLVKHPTGRPKPVKTADITNEEQARIDAAWQKRRETKTAPSTDVASPL